MSSSKNLDTSWAQGFFHPGLIESPGYQIDTLNQDFSEVFKLDQNESPYEWGPVLKQQVSEKLLSTHWNHYPAPYSWEIEKLLAQHIDVPQENILVGSGGSQLIHLLFSYIKTTKEASWVILKPSFGLYGAIANHLGLPFKSWNLDEKFQFTTTTLPPLEPHSVVIFATPNNPTGTTIPLMMLEDLLTKHPEVLFICDEAYYEFCSLTFMDCVEEYPNLLVLRTFSKSMGAAGLRCGYLIGKSFFISQLRKALRPYSLSHFTQIAMKEVLSHPKTLQALEHSSGIIRRERDQLYDELSSLGVDHGFFVPRSEANFLLMHWPDEQRGLKFYQALKEKGILVRNLSQGMPGAALRITVGTQGQNRKVISHISSLLKGSKL